MTDTMQIPMPTDAGNKNSAHERQTTPLQVYHRLGLMMSYAIALALIFRHTGLGTYEGTITFAGVFCAWVAGVLSTITK